MSLNDPSKPIIDHDPHAKMRPKPMSKTRRVVCFLVGLGCFFLSLLCLMAATDGPKTGLMLMAAFGSAFGGLVLVGSALIPNFTLARENLDRRRNR